MLTNAEIVIFNQFPDREKKRMVYVPHKIPKVWLYKDQKVAVGEHGLKSAELYKIRIPWPVEGWLPEQDFRDLAEPGEAWTVQNGDFFLKGDWDGGSVSGIAEIRKRFSGEVGEVLSHSENFYSFSPHIRIRGG